MRKIALRDYSIGQSLTDQLQIANSMRNRIGQTLSAQFEEREIMQTLSALLGAAYTDMTAIWQIVSAKSVMDKRGLYNKEEKV